MQIGIDVSLYDPVVDWVNYDWDFAFIKVSEALYPDPRFRAQWNAARGRTIRGAYHFHRAAVPPKDSVSRMFEILGTDWGELPPVLDLEADQHMNDISDVAYEWAQRAAQRMGKPPILYTSLGFINSTGGVRRYDRFARMGCALWLAEYPWDRITADWSETQRVNKLYEVIHARMYNFRLLNGFGAPEFIQFTGKCPPEFVPGYHGEKLAVDVNFCRLTPKEMFDRFQINFVPREEAEVPDTTITLTADLGEFQPSNLRNAPGLNNTSIRKTMTGPLTIKGVGRKVQKDGYYWIQIVEPYDGFVALTTAYQNVKYNENGLEEQAPSTQRFVVRSKLFYNDGTTQDIP